MIPQFENKVMSSALLYVDNKICSKGQAFTNHSSLFYPNSVNRYQGYYSYSSPYKQLVCDRSIAGANIISGVYVDGAFTTAGLYVNHYNGQVHFNSTQGSSKISGNYSIKDFSVGMTSESEIDILFETKYRLNPKTNQTITGLNPNQETYPAIYLKNLGGVNDPFAFGGMDNTIMNMRAVILADSSFKLDAACSILKDTARDGFGVVDQSDLPFSALGMLPESEFNYSTLPESGAQIYIKETTVTNNIPKIAEKKHTADIFPGFVDFRLEVLRYPRG